MMQELLRLLCLTYVNPEQEKIAKINLVRKCSEGVSDCLRAKEGISTPRQVHHVSSKYLTEQAGYFSNGINWDYILKFSRYHELNPLIYSNMKKLNLPEEVRNAFKQDYYLSCAKNMILISEFLSLKSLLQENKIQFLPLKGICFINSIYPDINKRSLSDIDLLISPHKIKDAEKILLENGYSKVLAGLDEKYWLKHHCHLMYTKEASLGFFIHLEIHWALDFKRIINIKFDELWVRRKIIEFESEEIEVLCPEDTIIALVLHQRRFHKPLILKNIIDGNLLLKKAINFNWEYVISSANKYRFRSALNLFLNELEVFYHDSFQEIKYKLRVKKIVNRIQKLLIEKNIFDKDFLTDYNKQRALYSKLHFLLYDSWWETLLYLIFLSEEKFAKYFDLKPYTTKSNLLYWLRFLYIPWRLILKISS